MNAQQTFLIWIWTTLRLQKRTVIVWEPLLLPLPGNVFLLTSPMANGEVYDYLGRGPAHSRQALE